MANTINGNGAIPTEGIFILDGRDYTSIEEQIQQKEEGINAEINKLKENEINTNKDINYIKNEIQYNQDTKTHRHPALTIVNGGTETTYDGTAPEMVTIRRITPVYNHTSRVFIPDATTVTANNSPYIVDFPLHDNRICLSINVVYGQLGTATHGVIENEHDLYEICNFYDNKTFIFPEGVKRRQFPVFVNDSIFSQNPRAIIEVEFNALHDECRVSIKDLNNENLIGFQILRLEIEEVYF